MQEVDFVPDPFPNEYFIQTNGIILEQRLWALKKLQKYYAVQAHSNPPVLLLSQPEHLSMSFARDCLRKDWLQ